MRTASHRVHAASTPHDLPTGFQVRLRDDLVRADHGRVLIGGSPARVVRLTERALELLADGTLTVVSRDAARLARRLLDGNLAVPILDHGANPDELTVVVPVRDRTEQLHRCLSALSPLRVIVVDDASQNPAGVARVAHRHGAQLVALSSNLGPAGARNAGLARVTSPLVAFVDSDVTVEAADLLILARHFIDPLVALVGPRVVGQIRSDYPSWFERYDAAASSLDLNRRGSQVQPGGEVGWLPGACLVARTSALGAGFQPGWRVAEDVDLVWRLVEAGYAVRYDPDVEAKHDVRASVRAWLGRKFFYGTGAALLADRHGDKVAPAALSVSMAFGAAAVMQRRWWSLPAGAATIGLTAWRLRPRLPTERGGGQIAVMLAARGLGWAVRQESGLLLRHWWPLAAVAAPFSRSVRRALATAVLMDMVVFLRDRPGVGLVIPLLARRLDDVAYGSGLWWGALRRRSLRSLALRRVM